MTEIITYDKFPYIVLIVENKRIVWDSIRLSMNTSYNTLEDFELIIPYKSRAHRKLLLFE